MSYLVASGQQTRWKDSWASSPKVNLTLIANGENIPQLYTPTRALVQAGFDAPTVAPTVADGGAGVLTAGYVAYRYVYASSQYPGVDAQQTAGGFLYPKSNPSPSSTVFTIVASHQNVVTVTKSERADVDAIFIYRTAIKSTSAEAQALTDAGELFYVGSVDDDSVVGTTTFADNVLSPTAEQLELDNDVCPQFWFTVYDGTFWWGWGNPPLIVQVTLDGATSITVNDPTFYSGRQNQLVTFDGINSGGFDGNGTFYYRYFTSTTAQVALTEDGTAATVPAVGTTTMRVHGFSSTLYRSKPNNPFAWGVTNYFSDDNGGFTREPELYALNIGGGSGSAIAIMQTEALLKLDCENPNGSYVLNLRIGGGSPIELGQTKRKLDGQYSIASQHAQFYATLPDGSTALAGIDAGNTAIVLASSASQNRFGSEVVNTVNEMVTTDDYPRLFHGLYNSNMETSIFWLKTSDDPHNLVHIDTCLLFHAPTGQWSTFRDFDVTASCAIFDPVDLETFILVGTANGKIAKAFVDGEWGNLSLNAQGARAFVVGGSGTEIVMTPAAVSDPGSWCLVAFDDEPLIQQFWTRANAAGVFDQSVNYFPPGSGSATTPNLVTSVPEFGPGPTGTAYIALIDCEAQLQFQPDQTKAGITQEIWGSFEWPDASQGAPIGRFYKEFDTNHLGDDMPFLATTVEEGDVSETSSNFVIRDVPSALTTSFGFRLIERGYTAFQVLGLNFKRDTTR